MIEPESPATAQASPSERAALALNSTKTERDLMALATKHTGITEIKDKAGREQAHGAAMELMRARTLIEKISKETRDDATKFSKAVIAEENRLVSIISNEEKRLKSLRDAWDAEQERIKREAAERERQRIEQHQKKLATIRGYLDTARGARTSQMVMDLINRLVHIDLSDMEEFEAEAKQVRMATETAMYAVHDQLKGAENERARLAAERAELERQQAEAQRQQQEREAAQRAEAERLAAERAEFARQQQKAEAKVRAAAEEMAQQRAEVERMRAELEAVQAKASAAAIEQAVSDAITGGVGVLTASTEGMVCVDPMKITLATVAPCHQTVVTPPDADLVDTAPATEGAEIRMGFDMAMSMPVITHDINKTPSDAPPATSLIKCIAFEYGVDLETACQWLCQRAADFEAWTQEPADVA